MKSLDLELNLDTGKFTGRMQQAGRETQKFERNVSGLNQELSKTDAKAKLAFNGLGAGIVVLGNLRSALENTRFFFTGLATAATNATAEIEKTFHLLKGMSKADTGMGQIAEATSNLEYLMGKAKDAPFSIQAMSDAFVKFKAGGLDPLNGGFQALLDSTAAFGGNDEVFKRAAVAIQQMSGKGVVSMEELRQQLGEAIPTAINMMAQGLGKDYQSLVKEIESGKLRAGPALEAMFKQMEKTYGGSAQRMMETYQGRVAQLKSSLLELSLAFTGMGTDGKTTSGGFYDTLKTTIEGLSNTFSDPAFQESVGQFGKNIGIAANALTMMVSTFGQVASFVPLLNNISVVMAAIAATVIAKLGGAGASAVRNYFATHTQGIRDVIAAERVNEAARKRKALDERALAIAQREAASASAAQAVAKLEAHRREVAMLQVQVAETERLIAANARAATGRNDKGQFIGADAHKAALRDQTRLTIELTSAKARLAAQSAMVTRSMAAEKVATDAATLATQRQNTILNTTSLSLNAMGKAAMAGRVAMQALNGAMAFLGGPWGLAIIAIASAFTYLSSEAAKAAQAGTNAANVLQEIDGAASAAKPKVDDLTTSVQQGKVATDDAATAAKNAAGAYDALGNAAANAAEYVKYLTAAQRQQKLEEVRQAKTELKKAQDGNGLLGMFQTNAREDVANKRAKVVELTLGRQMARADRFDSTGAIAERAARAASEAQEGSAIWKAYQEYKGAADAFNENNRRIRALGDYETELLNSMGTPTLERPDPVTTPTTPTSGTDSTSGSSKKAEVSEVQKALNAFREQSARIREEMGGASTEAAKMAAEISDGKFKGETQAVKDQLMAAARAMDDLVKKQKGAEAFKKLTDELAAQTQEAGLLDQQISGVLDGQTEAAQESAKFRVSLTEAAKLAEAAGISTEEMVEQLVAAEAATRRKNEQLKAAERLQQSLRENTQGAADAWDDYIAGTSTSTQQAVRLQRQLNRLTATFGGNPEELAKAQKIATDAFMQDSSRRAADRAVELRREMEEINVSLSGYSDAKRASINLDREAKRVYDEVVLGTVEGTIERRNAEQAYYGWKLAKERELTTRNPLFDLASGWGDMMGNMTEAFAGFSGELVDGLAEGNLAFEDFAKNMIKQLLKIIVQALIAKAILTALGLNNPVEVMDPMKSMNVSPLNVSMPSVMHTGGIAGGQGNASRSISGVDFSNMVRYHTGGIAGLKPKEVPAVLQEGEGVFTREQMANLAPAGGAAPVVKIEVINESGTPMDAQQSGGGPKFDGKEYVIGVVLDAVSKPGKMRDAFKGAVRS